MNAQSSGMNVETAALAGRLSADLKHAHDRAVELIGALSQENAQTEWPDTYKAALKAEKRIEQARGRVAKVMGLNR